MNSTVEKYFRYFKGLEVNKTTSDVETDIKHLNIKHNIKYYAFYSGVAFLSLSAYFGINYHIKSDEFRKALIEQNNIPPVASYFYSDYKSELEEIQQLQQLKQSELKKLQNSKVSTFQKGQYSYQDFINDVSNDKIKVDVDSKIKSMKVYEAYVTNYFTAYAVQNKDKTISINDNDYKYIDLVNKVKSLSKDEALEKLQIPSKLILKQMNLDSDNAVYIKALSNALLIIPSLRWSDKSFFENLKDLKLNNAVKDIKKAIYSHNNSYTFKAKNGRGYRVDIDKFEKEYNQALELEKEKQEKRYKEYQKNKAKIDKQITKYLKDIESISKATNEIYNLQRDVKNYKKYKANIEKLLDNVEGL